MFISHVDAALEKLLRTRLGLTEDVCDVAFEVPSTSWSAQLTRITVNLFLYDVARSGQPSRSMTRPTATGEGQPAMFRRPQPMVDLGYMVSAWAGSPRDEHQLLSDVISLFAGVPALPADLTHEGLNSSVTLAFGSDPTMRPREIWQGVSGQLKACAVIRATVAADTWDWEDQAAAVERVSVLAAPKQI